MDIELLSKMIAELVPDHNKVGLPGLGTFVSEFVPASFTDRGYTITPPYKRVTFVPGDATDNSLVELYARSNSILEDQARAALKSFLEETKKVLLDRKTVVFPGLGRLRATRQNNIFFITDEALDIYPEGFGLEPVSLKNHEETPAEVHHVVESLAGIMVAPTEEFVEPAGAANEPAGAANDLAGAANEPKGEVAAEAAAVAGGIAAVTGVAPAVTSPPVPEAASTEYEPIIPADERLEFADEPVAGEEPGIPEEADLQKGPKMIVPPAENVGVQAKKVKNDSRLSRKEARKAAREAKVAEKAAKAQAKAEAKAAKKAARVQAREQRKAERAAAKAARKAERAAAKAARREARAAAKAARRAARKPAPKWLWVTPLVILALAAVAAAIFFILVYAAPDFLDTLLYTPEELRIINW